MFLESVTEYFQKKAVPAQCIMSCNARTRGRRANLVYYISSICSEWEHLSTYKLYCKRPKRKQAPSFFPINRNRHNFYIIIEKVVQNECFWCRSLGLFKNCIITVCPQFRDRSGVWECLLLGQVCAVIQGVDFGAKPTGLKAHSTTTIWTASGSLLFLSLNLSFLLYK